MGAGASSRRTGLERSGSTASLLANAVASLSPQSRREAYAAGSSASSSGVPHERKELSGEPGRPLPKVTRPAYLPVSSMSSCAASAGPAAESRRRGLPEAHAEEGGGRRRGGEQEQEEPVVPAPGRGLQEELEVPAPELGVQAPPTFYLYRGQRFGDYGEFLRAVAAGAPKSDPAALKLSGDTQHLLAEGVRDLFREYAGSSSGLAAHEFAGVAASVAADLGMDPERFRSLSDAFDRFDVNGDGLLDEGECVLLAESMLRYYADAMAPRRPGPPGMVELEVKNLEQHYELSSRKLGQGGQGAVYLAKELATGQQRVVKIFDKNCTNAPLEEIKEEFRMLRALDHPRIQRLYDVFEDRSNVYFVAEPYYGGHLGDFIENAYERSVHVTSGYLARALHQVLQGVAHLHCRYITHCDLKEENVMVASDDAWQEPSLVVIDFGLAHRFAVRGCRGGTPGYMPPEVWTRGLWTPKGDVHALGVIGYQLFSNGTRCFGGWGDEVIKSKTLAEMPAFDAVTSAWPRCGDLLPLLEAMLQKDPRGRPTVKECMEHPFFAKRLRPKPEERDADEEVVPAAVVTSLQALGERTRLQRAVHADMAARQNLAGLKQLNAAFDAMDTDHDGVLTEAEVRVALQREGMGPEELEQVVQRLVGPEGQVAYTTFMGQLLAEKAVDEGRLLLREFEELDVDGSGYLELRHAGQLLKRPALAQIVGGRDAEELMARMDLDGDGRVVFEEFRRALSLAAGHGASPAPGTA